LISVCPPASARAPSFSASRRTASWTLAGRAYSTSRRSMRYSVQKALHGSRMSRRALELALERHAFALDSPRDPVHLEQTAVERLHGVDLRLVDRLSCRERRQRR